MPTAKLWLMNLAILRVFIKNCNGCERKASRCLTFWKWSQVRIANLFIYTSKQVGQINKNIER